MKKHIIVLAALALSSTLSLADCIHDVLEFNKATYLTFDESYDGAYIDSMYVDKGSDSTRNQYIYIMKYNRDGNKITSTYEAGLLDGNWEYRNSPFENPVISVSREGNVTTIVSKDEEGESIAKIYSDKDSLYIDEDGDTDIYYIRNDTLFRPNQEQFTINDPANKNICYTWDRNHESKFTNYNRYESSRNNDTLVLKRVSIIYSDDGLESIDGKYIIYFMPNAAKDEGTTIIRRIRPAVAPKKFQYFDLKGRPVNKNQHIMKVAK